MHLISGKRGMTILQFFIINTIRIVLLFTILMFFINRASSGELIGEQVLAKQIALLIDSARLGTEIIVNTGEFNVEKEGNEIKITSEKNSHGYSYRFFSKQAVGLRMEENNLIISVL